MEKLLEQEAMMEENQKVRVLGIVGFLGQEAAAG